MLTANVQHMLDGPRTPSRVQLSLHSLKVRTFLSAVHLPRPGRTLVVVSYSTLMA